MWGKFISAAGVETRPHAGEVCLQQTALKHMLLVVRESFAPDVFRLQFETHTKWRRASVCSP